MDARKARVSPIDGVLVIARWQPFFSLRLQPLFALSITHEHATCCLLQALISNAFFSALRVASRRMTEVHAL